MALTEFLRRLAHDQRNLVQALHSAIEGLGPRASDVDAHCLAEIAAIADRITRLSLAIAEGRPLDENGLSRPDAVIRDCRSILRRVADPFPLDVSLVHCGWIGLPRDTLERLAINLIRNARFAIDGSGRIAIRVVRSRDSTAPGHHRCILVVEDSGGGTRSQSGSGLGLKIVHELVAQAGGTMSIDRNRPRGWVVSCSFPEVRFEDSDQCADS